MGIHWTQVIGKYKFVFLKCNENTVLRCVCSHYDYQSICNIFNYVLDTHELSGQVKSKRSIGLPEKLL